MQKLLKEIRNFGYKRFNFEGREDSVVLTDMVSDSRKVTPGALFYARRGLTVDGRKFIPDAIARGAAAILLDTMDTDDEIIRLCGDTPVVVMRRDPPLASLAAEFFDHPSSKLRLIGVTGTNGKTTTCFLIAQMLEYLHKKCMIMGTLGCGRIGHMSPAANTTLEPIELQRCLNAAVEQGCQYAVMEVSSIGAAEHRVDQCTFAAGAFTNLTRDHLDYHITMENYAAAKARFLSSVKNQGCVVINIDDEYGRNFLNTLHEAVFFGSDNSLAMFTGRRGLFYSQLSFAGDGTRFSVHSGTGTYEVHLPLLGSFNVSNLMAALSVLNTLSLPFGALIDSIETLKPVVGRMERFAVGNGSFVIVDYAHTPDGVEQALRAAREHMSVNKKLICILGCGGRRDAGKRPIMTLKAMVNADEVILTEDNPRTEDPQEIIDMMLLGAADRSRVSVIMDRREAIEKACALAAAEPGSVAVICGKGHEDYQIFADRTIHFSDREEVCRNLGLPAPAPLFQAEDVK